MYEAGHELEVPDGTPPEMAETVDGERKRQELVNHGPRVDLSEQWAILAKGHRERIEGLLGHEGISGLGQLKRRERSRRDAAPKAAESVAYESSPFLEEAQVRRGLEVAQALEAAGVSLQLLHEERLS